MSLAQQELAELLKTLQSNIEFCTNLEIKIKELKSQLAFIKRGGLINLKNFADAKKMYDESVNNLKLIKGVQTGLINNRKRLEQIVKSQTKFQEIKETKEAVILPWTTKK
jgi:hypothetical protein